MNNKERITRYKEKVNDVIQKMIYELFKSQPENYIDWMIQYLESVKFQSSKAFSTKIAIEYNLSSEEEENEEVDELPLPAKNAKTFRSSVSAEVFGVHNKKENFIPRVIPKTEEQKQQILEKLMKVFMFQALGQHEQEIVVNAMEEKHYTKDDWVITQGDDGAELYIVFSGELDCVRKMKPTDPEPKFLKKYKPGDMFGELSLLYNSPRAASIQAKEDSVLFALDRSTFNNIVKDATIKKRLQYEEVLSKVELLQSMEAYEKTQICDGLKEQAYQKGEVIIQEGEEGDKFYMVAEGTLAAYKDINGQQVEVLRYQTGDYFGELALIHKLPRQATIIAETQCVVVFLDSNSFLRLLGPVEDILRRNAETYKKFIQN
ncbi:unnamed protein product [Paramecium octaurelia]|uniref:cAMP-dependent protein kinase regulatory subunit n=1 Tax=Paramecium octaurelia TaxID=43137 RepID=A0A8S1XEP9_PAROT|nr:unnamed protein product [Paramecium octaurelia]